MDWINTIGDKVFTEAGVLAFVLFWACIYLIWKNSSLERYSRQLNEKIYNLGMSQITAMSDVTSVLDRLYTLLHKKGEK